MKILRVLLIAIAVVCFAGCSPWGIDGGNGDSADYSTMSIMADNISSIAPYICR